MKNKSANATDFKMEVDSFCLFFWWGQYSMLCHRG